MNDYWNVLYQVSVFYAARKSKMATTAGHRLTLDPMGKPEIVVSGIRFRYFIFEISCKPSFIEAVL
jgi:hypothetical protein